MESQNRPRDPAPTMDELDGDYEDLDPMAFGFACGTTMALSVGLIGMLSRVGIAEEWRGLFADMYPGFESDDGGTLAGVVWAGADGFAMGITFGWLYNVFQRGGQRR
ncbi:bacteriophage holin [Natronorubrum daqingense]|nr:bacteriophage holin [Natronorubrum daqingense]